MYMSTYLSHILYLALYIYIHTYIGKVVVRCAQTGDLISTEISQLSNPEGSPVSEVELRLGSSLLLDVKGISYPMVFVQFKGI